MRSDYVVQYVGFRTSLAPDEFVHRWKPFAERFKALGIDRIDLYAVNRDEDCAFISRNIWQSKVYFDHFPSVVAGTAGGGGISVMQYGGYWIPSSELANPKATTLVFGLTDSLKNEQARERCTSHVPFSFQMELPFLEEHPGFDSQAVILNCQFIKSM